MREGFRRSPTQFSDLGLFSALLLSSRDHYTAQLQHCHVMLTHCPPRTRVFCHAGEYECWKPNFDQLVPTIKELNPRRAPHGHRRRLCYFRNITSSDRSRVLHSFIRENKEYSSVCRRISDNNITSCNLLLSASFSSSSRSCRPVRRLRRIRATRVTTSASLAKTTLARCTMCRRVCARSAA